MKRVAAVVLTAALITLLSAAPAQAEARDCPAFERGVAVSIGKANGTYPTQYRYYLRRGYSATRAQYTASGDASSAFWRSLILQTSAIVDYSTDPDLFPAMYSIANPKKMDDLGKAFGDAMTLCHATLSGNYPNEHLVR
jgi:hypothetical protein